MAVFTWSAPFSRAYKGALDINSIVTTETELNALLSNPTSYAGMLVACTSLNKIFMLNDTETKWIELSTNNTANIISVVNILPTPDVSIKDKYYLLSTDNKTYKCVEDANNSNNYIFQEISSTGIQIVNDYSILSSLPTEESIVYCKEDYVNITNETYVKGFYFYDTISSEWILISSKSKDYPNWESNILYEINDIVTYDNKHYKCLKEHTSSIDFNDDKNNWYRAIEQYYVVTQEQYDELIQQGIINDDTIDLYIIIDEQEEESIKTIVQDYSLLPEIDLLTEDIIIYCKDDYIDENNTTYKKGFYLYDLDLNKWNLINSSNNVNIDESTEDNTSITLISSEGTEYKVNAEKFTQNVGLETIEVLKAKEDMTLDDGTNISIGDVIEIHKFIGAIEIYSYCIIEEPLYNPFE